LIKTFTEVLNQMGIQRAIVLNGREKLDEAGLADITDLAILVNEQMHLRELNPEELGFKPTPTFELRGGDVQENVEILRAVLQGKGTQAQQNVVALNTALALYVGEAIPDTDNNYLNTFAKGVAIARDILQSGVAWTKFSRPKTFES